MAGLAAAKDNGSGIEPDLLPSRDGVLFCRHDIGLKRSTDGAIGTPTAVDFSWVLDTSHGADYFRRWHRERDKSGGLLVHKATHHFDAVNWFVDSYPQRVFCMGELKFYGKRAAAERAEQERRATAEAEARQADPQFSAIETLYGAGYSFSDG